MGWLCDSQPKRVGGSNRVHTLGVRERERERERERGREKGRGKTRRERPARDIEFIESDIILG